VQLEHGIGRREKYPKKYPAIQSFFVHAQPFSMGMHHFHRGIIQNSIIAFKQDNSL
jgi:hypothetical protein